ncbi:MAG: hypothetical protein WKF88_04420 [Ferruginibacter sp.]
MTLKQKIHARFLEIAEEKINSLQQVLADLKESGTNETKSTAGDKHETALAMLQIEQANTRAQLEDAAAKKVQLQKINPESVTLTVLPGSLIKTNRGYLYLSVAAGKINIEGITVTAFSPQSPLGEKLIGLAAGESAEVNNNRFVIETVE